MRCRFQAVSARGCFHLNHEMPRRDPASFLPIITFPSQQTPLRPPPPPSSGSLGEAGSGAGTRTTTTYSSSLLILAVSLATRQRGALSVTEPRERAEASVRGLLEYLVNCVGFPRLSLLRGLGLGSRRIFESRTSAWRRPSSLKTRLRRPITLRTASRQTHWAAGRGELQRRFPGFQRCACLVDCTGLPPTFKIKVSWFSSRLPATGNLTSVFSRHRTGFRNYPSRTTDVRLLHPSTRQVSGLPRSTEEVATKVPDWRQNPCYDG